MAKLSMQEVKNFKMMLHELKEAFLKKHAEAQGSRERIMYFLINAFKHIMKLRSAKLLGALASTQGWQQRR